MKFWTEKTPQAPSRARLIEAASLKSPRITSAPDFARARAAGLAGSRVKARTAKLGCFKSCRATAPPCCPVAPVTNIVFVFIVSLLSCSTWQRVRFNTLIPLINKISHGRTVSASDPLVTPPLDLLEQGRETPGTV